MSLRRLRLVAPTGYTFRASWESMCILGARGGEPGSTAATWTLTQMRRGVSGVPYDQVCVVRGSQYREEITVVGLMFVIQREFLHWGLGESLGGTVVCHRRRVTFGVTSHGIELCLFWLRRSPGSLAGNLHSQADAYKFGC